MAAENNYVHNELLYFLINNVNLVDNEVFLDNLVVFYSSKDINYAKKQLITDSENLITKFDKTMSRDGTKKEKLQDIIMLVKFIINNNCLDKMPCYISVNFQKVPSHMAIMNLNFKIIYDKIRHFETMLEKETNSVQQLTQIINNLEASHKKCMCKQSNTKAFKVNKINNVESSESNNCALTCNDNISNNISCADKDNQNLIDNVGEDSTTDNENDFTKVTSRKLKKKNLNHQLLLHLTSYLKK